jgi:tRNA G26 N,N-dimethylase Trm1
MKIKAERIIMSQEPPPRLSENRTYQHCQNCDENDICHGIRPAEKNCRSCKYARPIENAQWWCDIHSPQANAPIPEDAINVGCPSWLDITK